MSYIARIRIRVDRETVIQPGEPVSGLSKEEIKDFLAAGHIVDAEVADEDAAPVAAKGPKDKGPVKRTKKAEPEETGDKGNDGYPEGGEKLPEGIDPKLAGE